MDFDATELDWLSEILRGHQEAIQQVEALGLDVGSELAVELARRQIVLGSQGFAELVELITAHGNDMARHREQHCTLPPETLRGLEEIMASRLELIRQRITSIRYLLDGISSGRQKNH